MKTSQPTVTSTSLGTTSRRDGYGKPQRSKQVKTPEGAWLQVKTYDSSETKEKNTTLKHKTS